MSADAGHHRELTRGSLQGLALRVASVGIAFLFNVILVRSVGAAHAGVYYLALAVLSIGVVLSTVGLDNGSIRFAANFIAARQWADLSFLFRRALGIVVAIAVAWVVLVHAAVTLCADALAARPGLAGAVRLMILALPFVAAITLTSRYIQAAKRPAMSLFLQTAGIPSVLLAAMLVLPFGWSLAHVTVAYPVAAALVAVIALVYWTRVVPLQRGGTASFEFSEVLRSGRVLLPANLVNKVVQPWTAVICLGAWGSTTDVAWFSTASRVAALISFAVLPVNTIFAPKIAVLYQQSGLPAVRKLALRATLLIVLIAIPVFLPAVLVPGLIMSVFGPEFASAGSILLVLAFGHAVNVLTGPVQSILVMTGNEALHRRASLLGGLAVLLLSVWLIPRYGAVGAAWAVAGSLAITNLVSLGLVATLGRGPAEA